MQAETEGRRHSHRAATRYVTAVAMFQVFSYTAIQLTGAA